MFVIRKHLRPTSYVFPLARYLNKPQNVTVKKSFTTTQRSCAEEEENTLEDNPYYEKYKQKIKQAKASEVNYASPNMYNRALQKETQSWKKNIENLEKKLSEKKKKEEEGKISGLSLPAKLDELIKMELFVDKSSEEISKLWTEYWSTKETICAVITKDVFDSMAPRIKDCPMFLYPLPREHGYEFYLAQFTEYHCFCTSLINYQVHGGDAPWNLCFKFYPELKDTKGIVLMTSEFDASQLSIMEVQYLAQLQQLFYGNPTDERYELMKQFNHTPDSFKYMDVVKEIESGGFIVKK